MQKGHHVLKSIITGITFEMYSCFLKSLFVTLLN